MSDSTNPFQSPATAGEHESWWMKLRRTLHVVLAMGKPVFANGDPIICHGIKFFIDPQTPSIAYAASPSDENTEQRMNLIVAEVIRVLPAFLSEHPELHRQLTGRKLTIRIIDNYADRQTAFHRELAMEWDILHAPQKLE